MKPSAFIISILFIVLSIQPAFINWTTMQCINSPATCSNSKAPAGCCQKRCNAITKAPVKKPVRQQTENPCENCNPFMACNACPYVREEVQQLLAPDFLMDSENTNQADNSMLSGYNADCWHPPELFSIL